MKEECPVFDKPCAAGYNTIVYDGISLKILKKSRENLTLSASGSAL
jgi:hypothetical protein